MDRGRRTLLLLLLLAALAIVGGTAATLLSAGGAGDAREAEVPSIGAAPRASRTGPGAPISAPEPASLFAQVLKDEEGLPLADATVTLTWGPELKQTSTARTDARGSASFPDLLTGPVRWRCEADDREPVHGGTEIRSGPVTRIHPRMVASAVIEGRVVAAADGAPVAGARVTARIERIEGGVHRSPDGRLVYFDPSGAPPSERVATTDSDGRFRLRAGAPGAIVPLEASAPGFATERAAARVPSEPPAVARVEIRLERAGRIRGTVRDSRGNPVSAAHVSGAPPAYAWHGGGVSVRGPNCVSGPDGAFVLEGLGVGGVYAVQAYRGPAEGRSRSYRAPDGTIHIVGRLGDEGLSYPVEVWLPPKTGEAIADLLVPGWGLLSVTWRSAAGRNEGAARILAFPLDSPTEPPEIEPRRPGMEGFGLNLREGRWRIVVDSERHGCGEAEGAVVADGASRVEVIVGTAPSFEGVVVDGDGAPVPGVVVEAAHSYDGAGPFSVPSGGMRVRREAGGVGVGAIAVESVRWTTATLHTPLADCLPGARLRGPTDAAGRFVIDGLRPGSRWRLFVRGDALAVPPTGPFEAPSKEIRLAARRSGSVAGRVVLPPGVPVPETCSLHFARAEGALPGVPTLRSTAVFGSGHFRIDSLPPVRGTVWAETGGLRSVPVEVVVPEGGTAEAGDLALAAVLPAEFPAPPPAGQPRAAQGTLRGAARDSTGRPLAGWWIATRPVANPGDPWSLRDRVDYRGAFAILVPVGEHRVALFAPDSHEPAVETTVAVPEGGEVSVDLRVPAK